MFAEIAKSSPFSGLPIINSPSVIGAKPGRFMRYRLPVTGERPLYVSVSGLPEGLEYSTDPNVITGVLSEGKYEVAVRAKNAVGETSKILSIEVSDNAVPRSPLMGWTSWNAYMNLIDQNRIGMSAQKLVETGLADYGYAYVNIDSGWQGEYGGEYGGIMPNEFFPDMYKLVEDIHALGIKVGIYSSPMIHNFGPSRYLNRDYIGTTSGETDTKAADFGLGGVIHHERECARQWADFGFDYLKYDWNPAAKYHLAPMAEALEATDREFALSVTCHANRADTEYLMETGSSVRDNSDSYPRWDVVTEMIESSDHWLSYVKPGHFYDGDMLASGAIVADRNNDYNNVAFLVHRNIDGRLVFSEDETVFDYTARVILPSPIQLSCDLSKMTEFEFDVYTNNEVIAINQDSLCAAAQLEQNEKCGEKYVRVYRKPLENGDDAVAIFNIGNTVETVTVKTGVNSRDVWAKKDIDTSDGTYKVTMPPRTVKLIRTGN